MPINFNEALDTVTPNVPSYVPEGGGGMLGGASTVIDSITESINNYSERKAAERAQTTISGLVLDQLDAADKVRSEIAELDRQITEQQASVNPDDKETLARANREIARLNALKRQKGVDFSATLNANLRRDIAANPHLTDDLIKIYRNTAGAIKETTDVGSDIGEPEAKSPQAILLDKVNETAATLGTTPEQALLVVQEEARVADATRTDKLATFDGRQATGTGVTMLGDMGTAGIRKLAIVRNKLTSPEQAEVFVNNMIADLEDRYVTWRKGLQESGIRLSASDEQELRDTKTRTYSMLRDFAKGYGALNEQTRTEVANSPKFTTLLAASFRGGSPAMRMLFAENPELAVQTVMGVSRNMSKLQGMSPDKIREIEALAANGDADARLILNTISDAAKLDLAAYQVGGQLGADHVAQAAQIVRLISEGKTISGVMRPGTYAETLGLSVVAESKDPKALDAVLEKAEDDAKTALNGGDVRNIDTVARLIDYAPYRDALTKDLSRRASVVQMLQSNVINIFNNSNAQSNQIGFNKNRALTTPHTDKNMLAFSANSDMVGAFKGSGYVFDPAEASGAQAGRLGLQENTNRRVTLLNSSIRALKYYMKPADYQQWLEQTFGGNE